MWSFQCCIDGLDNMLTACDEYLCYYCSIRSILSSPSRIVRYASPLKQSSNQSKLTDDNDWDARLQPSYDDLDKEEISSVSIVSVDNEKLMLGIELSDKNIHN